MKQKRILVLSNMYPSTENPTFGIFVKNQVEALRDKGLAVDTIVINDPSTGKGNLLKKYIIWFLKALFTALFQGRKYSAVHAHYIFPTGILGLLFKKIAGTRLIVTSHGGDIDKMAKKNPRIRKWTKKILAEADHVIAVGHGLAHEIETEYGVPTHKLSIINMGVNRTVFSPFGKEVVREDLGLTKDGPIILYVGNIIREKGLLELIEAFKQVKGNFARAELHVIGSQKNKSFVHLLKDQSKGIPEVYLHDTKSQVEIAKWMSAADVFVLPSHMEGFGLVAVEAMSCHVPVVGTAVGGLKHLLRDGAGVLVEPENARSLYEGLNKVLADETLQQDLILKGEKKAAENDQDKLIKEVISLYEGNSEVARGS